MGQHNSVCAKLTTSSKRELAGEHIYTVQSVRTTKSSATDHIQKKMKVKRGRQSIKTVQHELEILLCKKGPHGVGDVLEIKEKSEEEQIGLQVHVMPDQACGP